MIMDGGNLFQKAFCVFIMLIIMITSEAGKLKCDPLEHVRYQKDLQECVPCDTCIIGFGKIPLEESEIIIDPVYGSTTCLECRPCKAGFFSDKHAYNCQSCTNCSLYGKMIIKQCTIYDDTVCGNRSEPKNGQSKENSVMETSRSKTDYKYLPMVLILCAVLIMLVGGIIIIIFKRRLGKMLRLCNSIEEGKVSYRGVPDEEPTEQSDDESNGSYKNDCYTAVDETESYEIIDKATPLQTPRSKYDLLKRQFSDPGHNVNVTHVTDIVVDGSVTGRRKSLPNLNKIYPLDPVPRSVYSQPYMTEMDSSLPTKFTETDAELTPGTMMNVARYLANRYRYRIIARCTGLSETDLINIQQNHRDDTTEQAYQVLRKLVHKKIIVKLSDLLSLLSRAGLLDIIEKLKQSKALD